MIKLIQLPSRRKLWGWDYKKNQQLRMTGKEWHAYARRQEFKTEHGGDAAFGGGIEVWLDGTDIRHK